MRGTESSDGCRNSHRASTSENRITYSFTFFYVDRLTENAGNQMEIQSVGIQTLDNIIRTLDDLLLPVEEGYTFQVFNQRFMDECAGVFSNVNIVVPVTEVCPEDFDYVINPNIMIV